ncbi:MAG: hypothetical protein LQ340_001291 [Diploschistes diacapsis]|nr:MAG: hypothetical protein LQ340_001291 [Diploschistes diacapsis]
MSSDNTSMAAPMPPANPYNQSFTLLMPDGTPFNLSISDLDAWYSYSVYVSIEYATQLGASLILLVTLALLTKPDKRHSPIFLINAAALFFNFLRLLLSCLYFGGPFSEAYTVLALDYDDVPTSAYGVSITAEIGTVMVLILVQLSLILQTQVVCLTLASIYRQILLGVSSMIGAVDIGWRLYLAVVNIQCTLGTNDCTVMSSVEAITNFVTTASIFWFSAVFVAKLGHAIHRRRKLGLRRWGSMHIIFTMGCQTLIIPGRYLLAIVLRHLLPRQWHSAVRTNLFEAFFSALQYLINFPAIGSFVLTLVAIFLPFSSLWATTAIDGLNRTTAPQPPRLAIKAKTVVPTSSYESGSDAWVGSKKEEFAFGAAGIEV